jgi:urease subunit alpha
VPESGLPPEALHLEHHVPIGDTGLTVEPEVDEAGGPDELLPGWGGTMRDGLGVRAERGGVDIAITGGLVLDPVLGVRRTSIGVVDGRIAAVGRAGNPDTMDGVEVVLDSGTAVVDAAGLIVTPGVVDSHVHFLSPQVGAAALAGGVTTLMVQDPSPVWNLGSGPASLIQTTYAAFQGVPLNVLLLVRGSAARPEVVEDGLRAGGGGLKIHEDVAAGPEQLRCAVDVCDRFDVQLAIHTDGLNEAIGIAGTREAIAGRPVHLFHIEGCGGGHAPNLLELAADANMLCSSTNPTVPFGVGAEAEHLAMVAAVHLLDPERRGGDWRILRERVRPATMAAEGVLHDLGVIPMTSSDSQGMGRIGEILRRMLQNAGLMKHQFGGEGHRHDNERVLRHIAKATVNPAITHGIAEHVGSLQVGRLADCALWQPAMCGVRPELVLKAGVPAWGASGDANATTLLAEPVRVGPQLGALGGAPDRLSLAFVCEAGLDAELPTARERAVVRGCRDIGAADMVRNTRRGEIRVDPKTHAVTLDGEVVTAPAADDVPLSTRYLLG